MIVRFLICALFLAFCNYSDWKEFKIKNKAVLVTAGLGLILSAFDHQIPQAVFGMLIPLVLLPLFLLHMLGAGDIKAFCALGAVVGLRLCVYQIAFSFVLGGVIALFYMIVQKNAKERFGTLFRYLKNFFTTGVFSEYPVSCGKPGAFRFSFAITAGFAAMVCNYYLQWI